MDMIVELKPPLILLVFYVSLSNLDIFSGFQESGILHFFLLGVMRGKKGFPFFRNWKIHPS